MLVLWVALSLLYAFQVAADTVGSVRSRGILLCGVNEGLAGFSISDSDGTWSGIDVDLCRAVAAAVIGNAESVTYIPLTTGDRFAALRSGEVDILVRNTTWTFSRDSELKINFPGVNYYDGQGFMTRSASGYSSVFDLNGATVCVTKHTTTTLNLADFFRLRNMAYQPVPFVRYPEMFAAYDAGVCDAVTADQSSLSANRTRLSDPEAHVILPEVISKEPLGPAVRHGDDVWFDVVKWSLYAMIAAEEYGVTSKNAGRVRAKSTRAEVRRLLGVEGSLGKKLGLPVDWAYQIVTQVGNYGESFNRHLGKESPIRLIRGLNDLWTEGGLMYAMPFR
jgi:general L-amino acid transport system substrate-binding protein